MMSEQKIAPGEQPGKPTRGQPVIMHSMQPKPGESDDEWASRMVKELKISLARQAGLIGDGPYGDDERETDNEGAAYE